MKLIDEKIKALGLTKGQYCEKYGFKFKDFAAKVHTLEAKLEWVNKFLEPLGLSAHILPADNADAALLLMSEELTEQMNDAEVRFLGSETPQEPQGIVGMGQELTAKIKNTTGKELKDGAAVVVDPSHRPEWCRSSIGCSDQFCGAEKFSSCVLDERGEFDDEPNADSLL